jgi:hypothetical protein
LAHRCPYAPGFLFAPHNAVDAKPFASLMEDAPGLKLRRRSDMVATLKRHGSEWKMGQQRCRVSPLQGEKY